MTQDIFEQHLTLSQQRLERLWQQADKLPKKSLELWRQAPEFQQEQQALLQESLEELSNVLEELQVATEELRQTNEELLVSRTALQAECQHYQKLFEFAPCTYLVTTKEGIICEANQKTAHLLQCPQQRLIGKPLAVFIASENRRAFYLQLAQLKKGEPINNWQVQIQPRRASTVNALCTAVPIQDSQHQILGLRWCIQDFTVLFEQLDEETRRLEDGENMKATFSESFQHPSNQASSSSISLSLEPLTPILHQILSTSTELFCLLDHTGKCIYINPIAANILGFSAGDLMGKTGSEVEFADEVREQIDTQWATVLNTKQPLAGEVSVPTVNGVREYQYTMTPICLFQDEKQSRKEREMVDFSILFSNPNRVTGKHNSLEFVVITAKDITEQKQATAIRVALSKTTELSALKSHLAAFISHELRDPLNIIACGAKLIEIYSQQWSEEKIRDYLQQIQANVKQIHQLLDDMLVIGKIEAGQQLLRPALMDITEFCRHLLQEFVQGAGRKHQLTLINQGSRSGVWDEKVLRPILRNLLQNAIKYSPEGSEVKLSVMCQDEQVKFSVQDSGIGIPSEEQELIFQTFGRGSNVGTIPGHGLGLAIAKQCVELQRGKISINSEVGVGTTVTITLPLNLRIKPVV